MATLKDYQSLVKKLAATPDSKPEERQALAEQKKAAAAALQSSAKDRVAKRKLKFTMDEINNS